MADSRWLRQSSYFSLYTQVLRATIKGGSVQSSTLSTTNTMLAFQGLSDDLFTRTGYVTCSNRQCACSYRFDLTPGISPDLKSPQCPNWQPPADWLNTTVPVTGIHGDPLYENSQVLSINYTVKDYPGIVQKLLPDTVAGHPLTFSQAQSSTVASNTTSSTSSNPLIISPFFEFPQPVQWLPDSSGLCLSWESLPLAVDCPQDLARNVQSAGDLTVARPALPPGKSSGD
jgi:hypothetical protein